MWVIVRAREKSSYRHLTTILYEIKDWEKRFLHLQKQSFNTYIFMVFLWYENADSKCICTCVRFTVACVDATAAWVFIYSQRLVCTSLAYYPLECQRKFQKRLAAATQTHCMHLTSTVACDVRIYIFIYTHTTTINTSNRTTLSSRLLLLPYNVCCADCVCACMYV